MKKLLLIFSLLCVSFMASAQSVLNVFTDWTGTRGSQNFFYKNLVKTDASNNVYIAGATLNSSNNYDILVAKYNSTGVLQWIQQYNGAGNGNDMALGLYIDASGNVYITGTVTTATNVDAVTIKYNSSGVQQWLTTYNGTGSAFDTGTDIITDASGNVYITGTSYNAAGNSDVIVIKYNSSGTQQWVSSYDYTTHMNDAGSKIQLVAGNLNITVLVQTNSTTYKCGTLIYNTSGGLVSTRFSTSSSTGIDQVNDVVTDAAGNIYIAGAIPVTGQGYNYDVIKLNSNLALLWERTFNGTNSLDDIATGVKVDASGNVYVTGYSATTNQGKDIITLKYNSSGTLQWSRTYNDALNKDDEANAMAMDASGNIYITGYIGTEADGTNYFTLKYDAGGNIIWTIQSDGNAHLNDKATNIAIDNTGSIVVTGESETAPGVYQYLTIKYVEKQVITPTDYNGETPPNSFSYYSNRGQLINTSGSPVADIKYYTINSSPAFYIKDYSSSFVFAHIDTIPSTNDTLQRIDVTYDKVNTAAKTYPLVEKSDYLNYFLAQCPKGITQMHSNQRLITTELYPSIDLMYSSNQDGMKYYYIIKPGGDPTSIRMIYTGATSFYLNGSTNELTINSSIGSISFERPTVYQIDASNNIIPITGWTADWQTNGASNKYKFYIGAYDSHLPLIIQVDRGHSVLQPQTNKNLLYSTYWGGALYGAIKDVAVGSTGNVYYTGFTLNATFPAMLGLGVLSNHSNNYDAIVFKLDNTNVPVWGTFYGGGLPTDVGTRGEDEATAIALGHNTNFDYVAIGGYTHSTNFPIFNPGGNAYVDSTLSGSSTYPRDMFVVKLYEKTGNPYWSTYLGGSTDTYYENLDDIAIDNNDNLYVVGRRDGNTPLVTQTGSTNDTTGYGYIAKFNTACHLVWATAFGGNVTEEIKSVAVDINNNLLITGITRSTTFHLANPGGGAYYYPTKRGTYDAFIAKFNSSNLLTWSTFFGGDENEEADGITTDNSGNIYITGFSRSQTNFPFFNAPSGYDTYHGPFYPFPTETYGDVFISKFTSSGVPVVSMLYGGSKGETGLNIVVDNSNRVYVTGLTQSASFPTPNVSPSTLFEQTALSNYDGQQEDAFLIALYQNMTPQWSTFYGGGNGTVGSDVGFGLATFNSQKLYMVGTTNSITAKIPLQDMGGGTYYQSSLGNTFSYNNGFFAMFDISAFPNAIDEINFDNGVASIYPNPVIDGQQLQISIDLKGKADISLEIFDITGKCILKKSYSNLLGKQILSINLDNYAKGIYVMKLFDNNNVVTSKIVKQ